MDPTLKGILIGCLMTLIGFGFSRLGKRQDKKSEADDKERQESRQTISELRRGQTLLEQQMAVIMAEAKPVAAFMQQLAIKSMTHAHTPETDKLLTKIGPPMTLTEEEIPELADALKKRIEDVDDLVDEKERIYARIFPDLIRLTKIETEEGVRGVETTAVLVKVPVDVKK